MSKTRTFGDLAVPRAHCDAIASVLGADAFVRLKGLRGFARRGQEGGVMALTSATDDLEDRLEGVQTQFAA
ncbi:hypothetical protein [Methylobacterium sp. P5_C11]